MSGVGLLAVGANEEREDRRQQHEHECLNEPDEHLHEVERDRNNRRQRGNEISHRLQHVLAGEDVSIETERERNRTKEDGNDLKDTDDGENADHHYFDDSLGLTFRTEDMEEEATRPIGLQSPIDPADKEDG